MAEPLHISNSLRRHVVQALADGGFHSGPALAESLGVSRAAIWKQLEALQGMGLGVERVRGRGYRLTHVLSLFDESLIRSAMTPCWRDALAVHLLESVPSTNDWLAQQLSPSAVPAACLAEAQPGGRGRRGRQWHCPYGGGIPLSLAWRFERLDAGLSGLAPALAVAVAQALESLGAEAPALKWPNDLVCGEGKLGGILVELRGEPAGPCDVRVGVGLNWVRPAGVDQPAAGRAAQFPEGLPDRSRVAGRVLSTLCDALQAFPVDGFAAVQSQWRLRDALVGRDVTLHLHDRLIDGRAMGLDTTGALVLRTSDGGERAWQVGEVSARLRDPLEVD